MLLLQGRSTRLDDPNQGKVELITQIVEEKGSAAYRGIVAIGSLCLRHPVWPIAVQPASRRGKAIEAGRIALRGEHARESFASAGATVPAGALIIHHHFVGCGNIEHVLQRAISAPEGSEVKLGSRAIRVVSAEGARVDVDTEAAGGHSPEPASELKQVPFTIGQHCVCEILAGGSQTVVVVNIEVSGTAALCVGAKSNGRGRCE